MLGFQTKSWQNKTKCVTKMHTPPSTPTPTPTPFKKNSTSKPHKIKKPQVTRLKLWWRGGGRGGGERRNGRRTKQQTGWKTKKGESAKSIQTKGGGMRPKTKRKNDDASSFPRGLLAGRLTDFARQRASGAGSWYPRNADRNTTYAPPSPAASGCVFLTETCASTAPLSSTRIKQKQTVDYQSVKQGLTYGLSRKQTAQVQEWKKRKEKKRKHKPFE